MDWSSTTLLAFGTGLALGAVSVGFFRRRSSSAERERAKKLAGELDEALERLEAQRAQVAKHFEETSDLFRDLTEQYTRLYAHLAEGAREFSSEEIPALGRGFGSPLLEGSGDAESAEEPRPRETPAADGAPPPQPDGASSQTVA
jgi:uncharacterized membrane-anchored protein YhcB (DUF1043 family)